MYKKKDIIYNVDLIKLKNNLIKLTFSSDCGKFHTEEILDEFEIEIKDLLQILQKNDVKLICCDCNVNEVITNGYCNVCGARQNS